MRTFYFTMTKDHADYHGLQSTYGMVMVNAANSADAREIMHRTFYEKWSFQYDDLGAVHPLHRYPLAVLDATRSFQCVSL